MKSGAINIDEYIGVEPEEQFEFIYTHYPNQRCIIVPNNEEFG